MLNEKVINAYCGCADEMGIWFIHRILPVLFYFSFSNDKIEKWKVIPVEMGVHPFPFSSIVKVQDKLYIIAGTQSKSFTYDIKLDKFEELIGTGIGSRSCYGAYLKDDFICVLPLNIDVSKRICLKNLKTDDGANWRKLYSGFGENIYLQDFHAIDESGAIYVPVVNTNTYLKYEMGDDVWTKVDIKEENRNCTSLTINKEGIYIYDKEYDDILKTDDKGNVMKKRHVGSKGIWIYSTDDFILADEVNEDKIILLDNELNTLDIINKKVITCDFNDEWGNCFWLKMDKKLCGILKSNTIIFVNRNGIEKEVSIGIGEAEWKKVIEECSRNTPIQHERNGLGLKNFIEVQMNSER